MPACEQLGRGRRVPARAGPARPCAPRLRGVVGGQRSAPGCSPGLCLNTPDPAGAGDRRPLSGGFSKQGICPLAQSSRGALPAQRPSLQDSSPAEAGACGVGCLSRVPRTLPQGAGRGSNPASLPSQGASHAGERGCLAGVWPHMGPTWAQREGLAPSCSAPRPRPTSHIKQRMKAVTARPRLSASLVMDGPASARQGPSAQIFGGAPGGGQAWAP